ncbi:MAG: hypothetical protein PVJ57_12835 [Phycisphaerae bacterium]|jgi:hypothetical protein
MIPWLATFFAGGAAYNSVVLVISVLGVALGAWALCLAYGQLKRVELASTAAKDAAEGARARLQAVSSLVDLNELAAHARELSFALRTGDIQAAAFRAFDSRSAVRRARVQCVRSDGSGDRQWQELVGRIVSLHEALQKSTCSKNAPLDHGRVTKLANKLADTLGDFVAKAAQKLGEN